MYLRYFSSVYTLMILSRLPLDYRLTWSTFIGRQKGNPRCQQWAEQSLLVCDQQHANPSRFHFLLGEAGLLTTYRCRVVHVLILPFLQLPAAVEPARAHTVARPTYRGRSASVTATVGDGKALLRPPSIPHDSALARRISTYTPSYLR